MAIFRDNFQGRCYVSATRRIYYENFPEKSVAYRFVVPVQHRRNRHARISLNFLICIGFFGIHWHFWRSVAPSVAPQKTPNSPSFWSSEWSNCVYGTGMRHRFAFKSRGLLCPDRQRFSETRLCLKHGDAWVACGAWS